MDLASFRGTGLHLKGTSMQNGREALCFEKIKTSLMNTAASITPTQGFATSRASSRAFTEKSAEMTLIRVGHHLWAQYKKSRGKSPQTGLESALYAAIEDVWRCKRELRAELEAGRVAKIRTESGRFALPPSVDIPEVP